MKEALQMEKMESVEKLKSYLGELFRKELYEDIDQVIGMHSIFMKPEYSRKDQLMLQRHLLGLIKGKINKEHANGYHVWLSAFPKRMSDLIESKSVVTGKASADVLASRYSGYGPFQSVDEFFLWAREDKRLPLGDIVKYIEKTAEGMK